MENIKFLVVKSMRLEKKGSRKERRGGREEKREE
jgi:hypothetical protein